MNNIFNLVKPLTGSLLLNDIADMTRVPGSFLCSGYCLCGAPMHVLPMPVWVSFGFPSKNMLVSGLVILN